MICNAHFCAINEKLKYPTKVNYNNYLPEAVPLFKDISLPHSSTCATPTGYNKEHTCFFCEQNTEGRQRKQKEFSSS